MKNILSNYVVTAIAASFLAACTVQQNMDDSDLKTNKVNAVPLVESKIREKEQSQNERKNEATALTEKFSSLESSIDVQSLTTTPAKQKARKFQSNDNKIGRASCRARV